MRGLDFRRVAGPRSLMRPAAISGLLTLKVVSIRRQRIGKVSLAKMPVGHWRYLPVGERF